MPRAPSPPRPLGFGLGLRPAHYTAILESAPAVDWFEVITENYLVGGGRPLHFLDAIRARFPIVMHGVSLSIGSTAPLDLDYIASARMFITHQSDPATGRVGPMRPKPLAYEPGASGKLKQPQRQPVSTR